MKRLKMLQDRQAELVGKLDAMLQVTADEDRDFSDEEQASYDGLKADLERVKTHRAREEELQTFERETMRTVIDPNAAASDDSSVVARSLEQSAFSSWGDFLSCIRTAETQKSVDPRLVNQTAEIQAATGMGEAIPSDGGFAVDIQRADALLERVYEIGTLLSLIPRNPIGANANGMVWTAIDEKSRATGSRWGGVRAYWVNEAGTITKSKPKLARRELRLEKVAALLYATDEQMQDWTALDGLVNRVVPAEIRFAVENAIAAGDGVGKPLGYQASGNNALVTVAKEAAQAADTIVYDNLTKMRARFWARARGTMVWIINQDCEPELLNLIVPGGGGVPAYLPPGGLSGSQFSTMFGRPVMPLEYAETLGDKGDISAFDPQSYLLIDKGGVKNAVSIHVKFVEDEVAFRWTYRVNGGPAWSSALTPFKGTNTLSVYVNLAARA